MTDRSPALGPEREAELTRRLPATRAAAAILRRATTGLKNEALARLRELLSANESEILAANARDVAAGESRMTPAFVDRLRLTPERLAGMRDSLAAVAELADPVGERVSERTLANGLRLERVRAPLGVIFMIFESRPNVAIESFSLALKSGNAMILRGGTDSRESTAVLYRLAREALRGAGLPENVMWGIQDPDRAWARRLLREKTQIDVVVPRGGDKLIEFVVENSLIPIIKNDRGLCHVYVHADADLEMAARIALNAKTQRPSTCNTMETLLVDRAAAARALPRIYRELASKGVRWLCDESSFTILKTFANVGRAEPSAFDVEHLDLILNCALVDGLEGALAHIEKHGSRHSESILTPDPAIAEEFIARVDAAAVYWNASTRFTDGFEMGLGGELGISTQKLHARGPIGLRELTTPRWIGRGTGQTRA